MSEAKNMQPVPLLPEYFETQARLLEKLTQQNQDPKGLLVTCSDFTTSIEQLLGMSPDALLVFQNVANLVPPYEQDETRVTALLEYAVILKQVPYIIVCGHTDCTCIYDFAFPVQQEVSLYPLQREPETQHQAIVERNVMHQFFHLLTYPFIRKSLDSGIVNLQAWVYHESAQTLGYFVPEKNAFSYPENLTHNQL